MSSCAPAVTAARSVWSTSTWMGSRKSTTGSAISLATDCCAAPPARCRPSCGPPTCWPASAATSSPSCLPETDLDGADKVVGKLRRALTLDDATLWYGSAAAHVLGRDLSAGRGRSNDRRPDPARPTRPSTWPNRAGEARRAPRSISATPPARRPPSPAPSRSAHEARRWSRPIGLSSPLAGTAISTT